MEQWLGAKQPEVKLVGAVGKMAGWKASEPERYTMGLVLEQPPPPPTQG